MKTMAPISFREALIKRLAEAGTFAEVRALDEGEIAANRLVVEGRFTVLNPGSRGKHRQRSSSISISRKSESWGGTFSVSMVTG